MEDSPPNSSAQERPASRSHPDVPRWAKVLVIAILVVIAVLIMAMLVVGGEHGPGRHTSVDHPSWSGAPSVHGDLASEPL